MHNLRRESAGAWLLECPCGVDIRISGVKKNAPSDPPSVLFKFRHGDVRLFEETILFDEFLDEKNTSAWYSLRFIRLIVRNMASPSYGPCCHMVGAWRDAHYVADEVNNG